MQLKIKNKKVKNIYIYIYIYALTLYLSAAIEDMSPTFDSWESHKFQK